ncbi:hypothetical protein QBC46DRAFT_91590 [Diplogelasinospora grovesii]|uniref:Uncharacterized protein n=1 Tax=Diplogelasinospora grovesii TaxID=303347 RepID=A0AAN6N9L3_9PEZI|nr:hypothetical protein QBC46DRAFT_91590 [Diplogelasinospora grovesii]
MATSAPTAVNLRLPSKYSATASQDAFTSPPVDWLTGTWMVTHSTLSMWRTARNVRITYAPLPAPTSTNTRSSVLRIDDLVEYEASSGKGGVKNVTGIDTASSPTDTGRFTWRGKGWLFFVTSKWEVLGWGERDTPDGGREKWAVTWFAPTLFTKEGVDIYSDRKEGGSKELVEEIVQGLKQLDAPPLVDMVSKDMREVEIKLPWKDR